MILIIDKSFVCCWRQLFSSKNEMNKFSKICLSAFLAREWSHRPLLFFAYSNSAQKSEQVAWILKKSDRGEIWHNNDHNNNITRKLAWSFPQIRSIFTLRFRFRFIHKFKILIFAQIFCASLTGATFQTTLIAKFS